jgi:CRISPR-associated protein Cas1
LLKDRFNSGVSYKGRVLKWDTVIEQKTMELARYVTGKSRLIDFTGPQLELARIDRLELRKRILDLSESQAKKLRIGKTTLHYLRENAKGERSFKVYQKVASRLFTNLHS